MKIPRDVAGTRVVVFLRRIGYEVVRQKGSHVRMRHSGPPVHMVTIPLHDQLKTGTLHAILTDVAAMRTVTVESLVALL